MNGSVRLYPKPRCLQLLGGSSSIGASFTVHTVSEEARRWAAKLDVTKRLETVCENSDHRVGKGRRSSAASSPVTVVTLEADARIHPQGYECEWQAGRLRIRVSGEVGLHYALVSVEQLVRRHGLVWDHFRIEDEPDFPVRGLMLDIGRNKIPRLETLYALIDRLSEMKMNHLQLHMEGFCFDYERYKSAFPDATPISAEEFRKLDAYARSRYIDLVPNQNCFGHMGPWLAKPEFRDLAEHPDGIPTPIGYTLPATTLNPIDPRSIELVKHMFDELLPNFTSRYVNINLDEPFGLGKGLSKARADEIGVGKLYWEFAEKVIEIVRSHGKKPLMWGDILTKYPEILADVPDEVTVLEWNYDGDVPFEKHCTLLRDAGVSFYVCPGTSSWSSITGRTENMLENIADAARSGKAYGAGGLIVTDWGDMGHWQSMASGFPGVAYAAGVAWQVDANLEDANTAELESCLNECVFNDQSGTIGNLLLELGRYDHLEKSTIENGTYTSYLLHRGVSTREKLESETEAMMKILVEIGGSGRPFELDFQYDAMLEWLSARKEQLARLELRIPDAEIVVAELANAIRLIEQGIGLHRYIFRIEIGNEEEEHALLKQLHSSLKLTIDEFNRLWRVRNRESGLQNSTKALYTLLSQYDEKLSERSVK